MGAAGDQKGPQRRCQARFVLKYRASGARGPNSARPRPQVPDSRPAPEWGTWLGLVQQQDGGARARGEREPLLKRRQKCQGGGSGALSGLWALGAGLCVDPERLGPARPPQGGEGEQGRSTEGARARSRSGGGEGGGGGSAAQGRAVCKGPGVRAWFSATHLVWNVCLFRSFFS